LLFCLSLAKMRPMTKYVFVTGGVVSSLGKGLTAASIALLLEARGLKTAMIKLDPYLNVDPGTMSPFQHGEVYVTDDGSETDLDLGHYSRFTNGPINQHSNATSGQIYDTVIKRERKGDYLGKTVQVIPHITDEIKSRIRAVKADVVLIEIGGTVGDIESLPFMEAIRQFRTDHRGDCINVHLTYVPYLKAAGELKTKPTQHSVGLLREIGIIPDMILCRCENPLPQEVRDKISLFCSVAVENVIDEPDIASTVYEVPMSLKEEAIDEKICDLLGLKKGRSNTKKWEDMLAKFHGAKGKVRVGIVGKYVQHKDAYKSVFEALLHAGIANGVEVEIKPIESDKMRGVEALKNCDGVLIPGGFGVRGWEGKIAAAKYCREKGVPFFGICLGMQVQCTEFARNVLNLEGADSTEANPDTKHPIISLLSEQENIEDMGGTMRLGAYPCHLTPKTKVAKIYGKKVISERHRHRFEFNNKYLEMCKEAGLTVSGSLEDGSLCEIVESQDHPWMIGVQFHPEFLSKPTDPHPLFQSFVEAMIQYGKN
jgi:CTP synthase